MFTGLGFRGLGFRGLGFRGLGFRVAARVLVLLSFLCEGGVWRFFDSGEAVISVLVVTVYGLYEICMNFTRFRH